MAFLQRAALKIMKYNYPCVGCIVFRNGWILSTCKLQVMWVNIVTVLISALVSMLAHDNLEQYSHAFWLRVTVDSGFGSWLPSVSDGWDSCLAAACSTRFWTSNDEGDVGNPVPFDSNFPAAHENAWPPSLTGASNNL